jgi:FkbM family methyltransferase
MGHDSAARAPWNDDGHVMSIEDVLSEWSESPGARNLIMPLLRGYIRYFPVHAGKPFVWSRIVEPYFAWHPRPFRARTVFGFSIDGDSSDLIQQWLYYFGVWEPWLSTFVRRRLRPGDTFVDVGANIGYYTLVGATIVGDSGRAVAIEASPSICARLARNVSANRADNVRIVNAAALGHRATMKLYRGNSANCGQTTLIEPGQGELECEVQAAPLHELLTDAELQSARLIKIDTEGAEYSILSGFDGITRLRRDAELVVEMHPAYLARRGESVAGVLQVMEAAGFVPYVLGEELWAAGYLSGTSFQPPRRLDAGRVIDSVTVLVFSRTRADTLE